MVFELIFRVNMSLSMHIDNKGKYSLILGEGPTQGLNDTKFIVKAQYSIDFLRSTIKFCLKLHYNWSNSFLFVNSTKIYHLKAKNSKIKKYP